MNILLGIAIFFWLLSKVFGGIRRFFRPTTRYINQCMINALASIGMSRELATAVLPVLKVMLVALGIAILKLCN